MYLKKILLIILLLIVINFLTNNIDYFQNEDIKLLANEPHYTTININMAKIKMNPDFNSNSFNIDVQKDIIVEGYINVHGKLLNIEKLRYIKNIPIHYQNEICLADNDEKECIKKEHIDMIKGYMPTKILTYPDNYRRCLGAFARYIKPEWWYNPTLHNIYTAVNCKNGDGHQEFFIKRLNDQESHKTDSHYHRHKMDKKYHDFVTLPVSHVQDKNMLDMSVFGDLTYTSDQLKNFGLTDDQIKNLDKDEDGSVKASELGEIGTASNNDHEDDGEHVHY